MVLGSVGVPPLLSSKFFPNGPCILFSPFFSFLFRYTGPGPKLHLPSLRCPYIISASSHPFLFACGSSVFPLPGHFTRTCKFIISKLLSHATRWNDVAIILIPSLMSSSGGSRGHRLILDVRTCEHLRIYAPWRCW